MHERTNDGPTSTTIAYLAISADQLKYRTEYRDNLKYRTHLKNTDTIKNTDVKYRHRSVTNVGSAKKKNRGKLAIRPDHPRRQIWVIVYMPGGLQCVILYYQVLHVLSVVLTLQVIENCPFALLWPLAYTTATSRENGPGPLSDLSDSQTDHRLTVWHAVNKATTVRSSRRRRFCFRVISGFTRYV